MDQRLKCKCSKYKTSRRKHWQKLLDIGFVKGFLDTTCKGEQQKNK